jgi:type I restriction enzyme S subunit
MPGYPRRALAYVLTRSGEPVAVDLLRAYKQVTVRLFHKGVVLRGEKLGSAIRSSQWQVREGQVLLSRIDARNGAIGIVPPVLDGAVVTNDFWAFTVNRELAVPAFLDAYFGTAEFVDACNAASEGTTNRVRLQPDRFLKIEVPFPSVEEQRRIASRIEELAARVEEARGLRVASADALTLFKKRVGDTIFDSLDCEKKCLAEVLVEESLNGISQRPENTGPGVEILRISAGTSRSDATVDESDVKYLPVERAKVESYQLRKGDLLACRFNGNLSYVGRFSLYSNDRSRFQVYPDKLIRFRVSDAVLPQFVRYAMNSDIGRRQIESMCATTAGNIGVSAKQLKTVRLPVPSVDEQSRIVAHLGSLQASVDVLGKLQSETAAELGALMPSILSKAFRGEL